MAWTTPKTWSSEPMTSTDLNTYVRDNQNYLKDRLDGGAAAQYATQVSTSTTANSTFVDVDGTNLNLTITTTGGDVAITVVGNLFNNSTNTVRGAELYVDVDGTDYLIAQAMRSGAGQAIGDNISCTYIIPGLSADSHTFKLEFIKVGATGNAAFVTIDLFDVREIVGIVS